MAEYGAYLESASRGRATIVHVLDLAGCIAFGASTEMALEATPAAIGRYLAFLSRHGEAIDAGVTPPTVSVVEHARLPGWTRNSGPRPTFRPDLEPMTRDELEVRVRRLRFIGDEIVALVDTLPQSALDAAVGRNWSARRIARHVALAQSSVLRRSLGEVRGMRQARGRLIGEPDSLPANVRALWGLTCQRLTEATDEDLAGSSSESGRTGLRRMSRGLLEHGWEHLEQLRDAVESAGEGG